MGQSNWGWACALLVGASVATAAPPEGADPFGAGAPKKPSAEQRIEAVLNQQLKSQIDAPGIPLRDLMTQISMDYDIPIVFDDAGLDAAGTTADADVSININKVTLRSALELILKRGDLTYVVQKEVIEITTQDEADKILETQAYPVADIQKRGPARKFVPWSKGSPMSLADVVVQVVDHDTWQKNKTGHGQIAEWPGVLIVTQTRQSHEHVADLLAKMRGAVKQAGAGEAEQGIPVRVQESHDGAYGGDEFGGRSGYRGGYGGGRGGYGYGGGYSRREVENDDELPVAPDDSARQRREKRRTEVDEKAAEGVAADPFK